MYPYNHTNMKAKLLFAACAATLFLFGCQQQSTNSYIIKGDIQGIPNGSHIQLYPLSHASTPALADTTITDGKFVFTGKAEAEPRAAILMVKGTYGSTHLILENGNISITGKVSSEMDKEGNVTYDYSDVSIKGSPLTERYRSLLKVRGGLDSLYAAINNRFARLNAMLTQARLHANQQLKDSLYNSLEYKQLQEANKSFFATIDATYNKLYKENKDSFWGPLLMISTTSYLVPEDSVKYNWFSQAAKDSYYGKQVYAEIYPAGKVGTKVPAFTLKDRDGKTTTLAELSKGKKYILLDFWASWCVPCRKEIPNLKANYAKYSDKGFQIISISIDKKAADWEKALDEEKLTWPNFLDTTGIADTFQIRLIPTMYLVDAEGTLVAENPRGELLGKKLAELLK
jgi:peroxiredoxin